MILRLAAGNSTVVELRSLRNTLTGALDEAAAVALTIRDGAGTPAAGQIWPAVMAHAGNGVYRVTLEADLVVAPLNNYTATVVATGSGGEKATWVLPVEAYVR